MSRILRALGVLLCAAPIATRQTVGDDFNDDVVNPTTWGADSVEGAGGAGGDQPAARVHGRLADGGGRSGARGSPRSDRSLQAVTDVALVHLSLDDLLRELLSRIQDILDRPASRPAQSRKAPLGLPGRHFRVN